MGTCCSTDNDQDPNADNNAKLSDPLLAAQEAAETATGAAALQSAVATGDLSASAQAAMNLAASAAALRNARGKGKQVAAAQDLAAAAEAAAARIEADEHSPMADVMVGMAKAATKIKLLAKVAPLVPIVGPTAGGILLGLARVCEAAARYRKQGKAAR